jgi:hypothetical protein
MKRVALSSLLCLVLIAPARAGVVIVQDGDTLTVVVTQTFEKNGVHHLENLRVVSRMWEACGPEKAKESPPCEYGALYRVKSRCTEELAKLGGCKQGEVGQDVVDARTLEEWLDHVYSTFLRSMTRQGRTLREDQLLPADESTPEDLGLPGGDP